MKSFLQQVIYKLEHFMVTAGGHSLAPVPVQCIPYTMTVKGFVGRHPEDQKSVRLRVVST